MRQSIALTLALFALSCSQDRTTAPDSGEHAMHVTTPAAMPQHVVFLPGQANWKDGPPSLPPGAKFVVLEGDPSKEGYFAMRAMLPDGYRIPPHWHPNVERVTIISGTFHLGAGERFDRSAAQALPAGSYSTMQPGMTHFGWAEGQTVIQVTTLGPWAVNYVNPSDDPRRSK
jgi:hypothetical protein